MKRRHASKTVPEKSHAESPPVCLHAVILAAGASRRMGSPKALLELGGKTFLELLTDRYLGLELPVWVVSSPPVYEKVCQKETGRVRHLLNPAPEQGPLSSIRIALGRIEGSSGFFLQPVDHPLVSTGTLRKLMESHLQRPAEIVIPSYHGQKGHPVIFPSVLYDQLREGPLAEGARWVVRNQPQSVRLIPVNDSAILANLNTAGDLERWGLDADRASRRGPA